MKSESLTLVGFHGDDLGKMYDALEVCARTKHIQSVEVFIRTLDEIRVDELSVFPGLCMVRVPEPENAAEHCKALMALSELADIEALAVIPVLKPYVANGDSLKAVGLSCPIYLNIDSGVRDYVAMFSSYLFSPEEKSEPIVIEPTRMRRNRQVAVEDNAWI